jgi:type VI secretion system protein ImpC
MAAKSSFGKIQFEVSLGDANASYRRDPEAPFGLAVLGDFSGRRNRSVSQPIDQHRISRVDCDNFGKIMAKVEPKLRLPSFQKAGETMELRFTCMEDFHPDQILKQAGSLKALLETRKRLLNPSTATAAADELQSKLASRENPSSGSTPAEAGRESDTETMTRLLGSAPQPASAAATPGGAGIDRLIKSIVAPSIVPSASPQQAALLSILDLELTKELRAILHHPDFQALEATWRALDLLVRNFGGEANLKLHAVDISKDELAADLNAQEALDASAVWKLLRRQSDEQPWTVCVGQYIFEDSLEDIQTLGRLGKVFAKSGTIFISAASPQLAGCDSFHAHPNPDDWKKQIAAEVRDAWQELRNLRESSYLGLALPRFLARQPYGRDSEPIESFPFEEMAPDSAHEHYLWGNSCIVSGFVLAEAFREEGWEMEPRRSGEVGELPIHKFKQDDETKVKPCAEAWLSERAGETLRAKGLIPVLSIKGRDAVRVGPIQSLAGGALSIG